MAKAYTRKKPVISGTISPVHKKRVEKLVESGEFASISDFLNQAVSDLLSKYDEKPSFVPDSNMFTEDEMTLLRSIIREKAADMEFEKGRKKPEK
ncbi:hypothetical protein MmiAt1_12210 [Methanimicrococcus sp. At1]|uniref:Uncharacterized protein n=1 Tax=Methanimicrococcus hacksteinii TaxID=3028293 RepID=A0ABU3VQD8_9EURY|nr:hypothetical protein [Methanimicrococcus sp. At1]MDV0445632.1 hypothetical protein [Methanimicrococcus sp. At1]